MSVSFGRAPTQNSFPLQSARTVQDSAPVCPMLPGAPERKTAAHRPRASRSCNEAPERQLELTADVAGWLTSPDTSSARRIRALRTALASLLK